MIIQKTTPFTKEETDQIIAALAMDLKRVALAKHNKSNNVANRFWQEILNKKILFLNLVIPNYIKNLYDKIEKNNDKDNLLMYSVILQNYATRKT